MEFPPVVHTPPSTEILSYRAASNKHRSSFGPSTYIQSVVSREKLFPLTMVFPFSINLLNFGRLIILYWLMKLQRVQYLSPAARIFK